MGFKMKLSPEDLLFHDELAPITSELAFVEAECSQVVEAFLEWWRPHLYSDTTMHSRSVSGSLREVILTLLPLTTTEKQRFLFIPTSSTWTAYLANKFLGSDSVSIVHYLAATKLRCRGIRIVTIPNTIRREKDGSLVGRYGILSLAVANPIQTDVLPPTRLLQLENEHGRWYFTQRGEPFPFEDMEQYALPRQRDRFSFELLRDYLKQLGLSPFEEEFYLPSSDNTATLIEKISPPSPYVQELTLEEARTRASF